MAEKNIAIPCLERQPFSEEIAKGRKSESAKKAGR